MAKAATRHLRFYEYSSRNRVGGKTHPVVFHRYEQALNMWYAGSTRDEIAMSLDISPDTVRHYLKRGKRRGDIRVTMRRMSRRNIMAEVRKMHIVEMAGQNIPCQEIAKRLNVHVRLVQMRLKEATDA